MGTIPNIMNLFGDYLYYNSYTELLHTFPPPCIFIVSSQHFITFNKLHSGQNKVMTAEALIFRMLRLILQHGKREGGGGGLYTYLILHTYKNLGCLDQIRCVVSFFLNFQGWDDDEVFGRRRSRIFFSSFLSFFFMNTCLTSRM